MTLVSVVVPSYRHANFIVAALASVFRQAHSDLELILVDDCSPDETFAIAERLLNTDIYRERFKRIVCVQNSSNLGAPSTINLGISLARGEWIALLNSDDVFHEMRLSHLLEFADDEKAEFVFSKVSFIYDDSTILRSDRLTIKKISEAQANAWRFKSIKEALFNFNFCATSGNMLFKNEVMAALGGFKPLQYCHDWEFILRAVDQFSVSFLPEILYGYRLHGENSFKSLAGIAHHESEVVARGVRERSLKSMTRSLVWEFGSLGILATWNGHH